MVVFYLIIIFSKFQIFPLYLQDITLIIFNHTLLKIYKQNLMHLNYFIPRGKLYIKNQKLHQAYFNLSIGQ